jgi:cytidylate kinase
MSGLSLNATIEKRLDTLVELGRRNQVLGQVEQSEFRPTITISREFGCEGFAVAQIAQSLLQEETGTGWGLMDKEVIARMAGERNEAMETLRRLGEKNGFLDEMMSTLLTNWNSDKDYYRLLCSQISLFAKGGHVLFVGLGATILTQNLPNCYQFRIVAPMEYRVESMARRHNMSRDEANSYIQKNQKQRVAFINEFLSRDVADPTLYHMIFNREKNTVEQIAQLICERVLTDIQRKR